MQHVPSRWYHILNWSLTSLSAINVAVFGLLIYTRSDLLAPLGLTILTASLAIVQLSYGLIVFRRIAIETAWGAGLVSLLLATLNVVTLVHTTGGFDSWYFAAWLGILAVVGMFGLYVTIGYGFLITSYLLLVVAGGFTSNNTVEAGLVGLLASYAIGLFSHYLWKRSMQSEEVSHVVTLGKELADEQLKSEALISSITDGVVVIDTNSHIQLINPSGAQMIGWKVEEAIDLDYHSLFRFFGSSGKEEVELDDNEHPFTQLFSTGKAVMISAVTLATKDNKDRLIVSLSVSPIKTDDGTIHGAVAVFRNVSAEKRQERQRTEFISTASHEMRTPIAAIEGYLSLAMNEKVCRIDTKAHEILIKAHDSTQHLGELFKDLLAASKSEDGRLENHPKVIELGVFVEQLIEDIRFSVEKKGLRLDYLVSAQAKTGTTNVVRPFFYIQADPERIREVLTNLINNAVKFTEEGGVTVGIRGQPDYIQISIKDTGMGIPESDISHLFQKFYRVDNSATRTIGGTGLGLFISRNIVEMYKGRIWVESKPGGGSTFYVNLPRITEEQATSIKQKETTNASVLST